MRKRQIPILGPSYVDPNLHWSRQDTLNWLLVKAEQGGTLTQWQLRDAPGVEPFVRITREVESEGGPVTLDIGPVRGMRNVEGKLFVVAAQTLYQISNNGVAIPFGTIPGVARVSMAHNQSGLGNELIIVNGSAGYVFNTNFNTLTKITDEGYPGAFIADYIDQYLAQVEPQGRFWFHSDLANGTDYNTLDRYEAEADPDRIVSLIVSHREVLVFGRDTIEPFVNTGGQTGTFERATNTVVEVGCAAKFTPRKLDNSVFWLDDKRLVRRLDGYTPIRISTDAIDSAFQECSEAEIAACYAFTWESRGHKVYYITVPGRFTFGYDVLTGSWHRRSTWNMEHWDVVDAVYWNGRWITGSGRFGRLYELDWDYKLDSCDPLVRKRVTGKLWDDENELTLNNVELKFNTGGAESVCVLFPDQPVGPTLTGDAPDADPGPYTFTYTATPGDAPISRTIIMRSWYVQGEDDPVAGLPSGWAWNQSTATISNPSPAGEITIHLDLRTYDTNGLFDDHSDMFSVSDSFLLITGSAKPLQDPMWAKVVGALDSVVGIPTSTGANVANSILGYFDGVIASVHENGSRYSTDRAVSFLTSTLTTTDDMGRLTGGPEGWMADLRNFNSYPPNGWSADPTPTTYTSRASPDFNPARTDASRFINGYYYRGSTQVLRRSADLIGGWAVCSDGREFDGQNGAFAIQRFFDLIEYEGKVYACVAKNFNEATTRYQIRWRNYDDFYWPTENVVYDVAAADGGKCPMQLCVGNGELVTYCLGGGVLTSANDFSAWVDTGLDGPGADFGEARLMVPSWRIAYDRGRFYVIGYGADGDKITASTNGLTWDSPVTMPITSATCILRVEPSEV